MCNVLRNVDRSDLAGGPFVNVNHLHPRPAYCPRRPWANGVVDKFSISDIISETWKALQPGAS